MRSEPHTISKAGVALVSLVLMGTAAEAALVSLQRTPYDRQLERVQHVLIKESCENNGNIGDIETINNAMRNAYRLPYTSYKEWQSPEETMKNKRADCKARAIMLHHELNQAGVGSHRLVIGSLKGGNSDSHTWLVWKTKEAEYLLDPTYYRKAIEMEKVSAKKYIPEFIYCGGGKYGYVPNTLIYEGLGDIPQQIKDRSKKTRIFLAEDKEDKSPVQVNREKSSSPDVTESKQTQIDPSTEESSKEVRSKASDNKSGEDSKVVTESASLASLHS